MTIKGRQVIIKQDFDDMLDEILSWYISEGFDQYAQDFLKDVYETIVDKIAPFPERQSEYQFKRTPDKIYRRYIFKKKYYIIFKISQTKLELLAIVYSRRDLNKIPID
jgi:hypothetical protein